MAVQSEVNYYPSVAVAGDRASQEPVVTLPYNCTAEGEVTVGNFVWAGTDEGQVTVGGDGDVLGFVVRGLENYNYLLSSEGTLTIPEYHTVTVAVEGDFYALTTTDATVGQKVFATTEDGSIQTGDEGASVDGAVETRFYVKSAGSADDLIIIGTWGA